MTTLSLVYKKDREGYISLLTYLEMDICGEMFQCSLL